MSVLCVRERLQRRPASLKVPLAELAHTHDTESAKHAHLMESKESVVIFSFSVCCFKDSMETQLAENNNIKTHNAKSISWKQLVDNLQGS
jgi:hypothetical protein